MSEKNNTSVAFAGKKLRILKVLKYILISYVLSLVLIALLSALVVYTDIPESICVPAVKVITFFSVIVSAYLSSKTSDSRGWLCGALVGGFNILLLIILGTALFGNNPFTQANIISVLIGCFLGSVGGIVGINSKKE